jgi:hypothetical protein
MTLTHRPQLCSLAPLKKKKKTRDVENYRVPSTELLVARLEYRMATTFLAAQAHDEDSEERQWST